MATRTTRAKCVFIDDIAEEEQSETDDVTEDGEGEDSDVGEEDGDTDEDDQLVDDKYERATVKKRIHQNNMDFYRQQLFLDTLAEEDKLLCTEDALLDQVGETSDSCETEQKSNKRRRRIRIPEVENENN